MLFQKSSNRIDKALIVRHSNNGSI